MMTLWRRALNLVTAAEAGTGTAAAAVSLMIIIGGVAVPIIFRSASLSTKEKHVI